MENKPKICTTSGRDAETVRAEQKESTGQHKDYIVLCPDERAKGFVRPYRDRYIHVGDGGSKANRTYGACGTETRMGGALSETYACDPKFYGATFCVGCNKHLPVGEFIWSADGVTVGE